MEPLNLRVSVQVAQNFVIIARRKNLFQSGGISSPGHQKVAGTCETRYSFDGRITPFAYFSFLQVILSPSKMQLSRGQVMRTQSLRT